MVVAGGCDAMVYGAARKEARSYRDRVGAHLYTTCTLCMCDEIVVRQAATTSISDSRVTFVALRNLSRARAFYSLSLSLSLFTENEGELPKDEREMLLLLHHERYGGPNFSTY